MPLRIRLTDKTINPDNTLSVTYMIAWANAQGVEVWSETQTLVMAGEVTRAQVLSEIRQIAEQRAGAIAASVALEDDLNRTYERQSNGTWLVV